MAYVAQQAWLQNASLKDNITWGQPVDEKKYQKVISACALQSDLDMLPAGDMTEIGEKVTNEHWICKMCNIKKNIQNKSLMQKGLRLDTCK